MKMNNKLLFINFYYFKKIINFRFYLKKKY